jgi:hypothetical protein
MKPSKLCFSQQNPPQWDENPQINPLLVLWKPPIAGLGTTHLPATVTNALHVLRFASSKYRATPRWQEPLFFHMPHKPQVNTFRASISL